MYIKLISITVLTLIFTCGLFAQDTAQDKKRSDDEGKVEEVIDWAWPGKFYPFIEVSAGLSTIKPGRISRTVT